MTKQVNRKPPVLSQVKVPEVFCFFAFFTGETDGEPFCTEKNVNYRTGRSMKVRTRLRFRLNSASSALH